MVKLTADINLTSTLLEKVWATLIENGLVGLLKPWQTKRVAEAETEARTNEIIAFAQAEKHAEEIIAGRKQLLADGTIVDVEPLKDEHAVLRTLEASQRTMLIRRGLNLFRIIDYLGAVATHSDTLVSDEPVSPDWFAHWRGYAENFSEERYQRLWAAVLTGEVRQPGSFSILTMDILASISSENASIFQQLCDMSFSNGDRTVILLAVPGVHGTSSHYHLKSRSGTMGEQLKECGIEHFQLLSMRTLGLLASLPAEEYPEWNILLGEGVDYAGRPVVLQPKVTDGRINVISFTEAGHQLRNLINKTPHETYTPFLQSLFEEADVVIEFG